jgi:hypothetical protein
LPWHFCNLQPRGTRIAQPRKAEANGAREGRCDDLPSIAGLSLKKIKSSGADIERSFPLHSISPRSRSPIEAAQAQHRRRRLLPITRRFFLDAFTQGVKLLLRDPVNLGGNFHYGHGEKLCRKAQMQFVREVDMLLQRPCH